MYNDKNDKKMNIRVDPNNEIQLMKSIINFYFDLLNKIRRNIILLSFKTLGLNSHLISSFVSMFVFTTLFFIFDSSRQKFYICKICKVAASSIDMAYRYAISILLSHISIDNDYDIICNMILSVSLLRFVYFITFNRFKKYF